jgi:hypothetical protein
MNYKKDLHRKKLRENLFIQKTLREAQEEIEKQEEEI